MAGYLGGSYLASGIRKGASKGAGAVINTFKPKNPVTRTTTTESRATRKGATVLEEGSESIGNINNRTHSSLNNSHRSTGEKSYTLNSEKSNWKLKPEIPRTAVKNSEGNYTLGRGNEWNFNTKYKTPYIGTGNKRKELISSSSSKLYSVVPEMHELDKGRYTFRPNETGYVKNPTAQNITNYINNTNYLGTGGKKGSLNGLYMYVVDANNNIIIGNRAIGQVSGVEAGKGLPHPTLIGGFEPKVQGAGIVTIQGEKIIKVDNASGHFRPDSSSLGKVEKLFLNKVPDKYYDRKFEGFVPYEKE